MITPSYGLTATERVLPSFTLDWTIGLVQSTVDVTRAGVATFVGSNGLIQSATADTQRIDYSTGVAGLLVEESRTNFFLYSDDFSQTWLNISSFEDTNVTVSPDGTVNADKFIVNNGVTSSGAALYQSISKPAAATTYVSSLYVKPAEYDSVRFVFRDAASASNNVSVYFNAATGAVASGPTAGGTFTSVSASITSAGNGWYRCVLVATTSTETSVQLRILPYTNGTSTFVGDGTSGLYIWGAQLEAGAFPTSYIPTEASAVTRNADVATVTGTNFSDFFNPTEGTFLVQSSANAPISGTTARVYASVDDTTADQFIALEYRLATQSRFRVQNVTSQTSILSTKTSGGLNTVVAGYKTDSFIQATNTTLGALDSSGDVPVGIDNLKIGSRYDSSAAAFLNGTISKLAYWPYRLTNAEIQAFSKG